MWLSSLHVWETSLIYFLSFSFQSVTVVGHRAGASLVTALTAMPKRRGAPIQRLFHQVSNNFRPSFQSSNWYHFPLSKHFHKYCWRVFLNERFFFHFLGVGEQWLRSGAQPNAERGGDPRRWDDARHWLQKHWLSSPHRRWGNSRPGTRRLETQLENWAADRPSFRRPAPLAHPGRCHRPAELVPGLEGARSPVQNGHWWAENNFSPWIVLLKILEIWFSTHFNIKLQHRVGDLLIYKIFFSSNTLFKIYFLF